MSKHIANNCRQSLQMHWLDEVFCAQFSCARRMLRIFPTRPHIYFQAFESRRSANPIEHLESVAFGELYVEHEQIRNWMRFAVGKTPFPFQVCNRFVAIVHELK